MATFKEQVQAILEAKEDAKIYPKPDETTIVEDNAVEKELTDLQVNKIINRLRAGKSPKRIRQDIIKATGKKLPLWQIKNIRKWWHLELFGRMLEVTE